MTHPSGSGCVCYGRRAQWHYTVVPHTGTLLNLSTRTGIEAQAALSALAVVVACLGTECLALSSLKQLE